MNGHMQRLSSGIDALAPHLMAATAVALTGAWVTLLMGLAAGAFGLRVASELFELALALTAVFAVCAGATMLASRSRDRRRATVPVSQRD